VIPVYYGKQWIAQALQSVRDQRFSGQVRIVIVEDGTPAGETVFDVAKAHGATYVALPKNRGVFSARWRGLEILGPTDFVAFLDQDDWWHPDFLDTLVRALVQDKQAPLAASDISVVENGSGESLYGRRPPRLRLVPHAVQRRPAA